MHQDRHLEGCVGRHTRVLALYDSSDAFWHALPPHDEPTAISPPRGEEEAGYMWQVKRATYKTRRASRLFQEHMKLLVLGEAGFAALKVCYQVYYCPDTDSMAASHGEELDRLDEVSKRLVVVEVPDRIRPGAEVHGQYLKRHIVHIEDQGLETSCCDHQKPFQCWCEKDLGRRGPEALDELAEPEAKFYQQDTGMSVCVSSGRFDMRFYVKRLSAMMSKPRKMGDLCLTRLSRYVVKARRSSRSDLIIWRTATSCESP